MSGNMGFWVTARGTLLTEWDISCLTVGDGDYHDPLLPITLQPGPDAMRWWPEESDVP
jgi:hypothetical protein